MLTHDIDTSLLRFGTLELEQTSDDGMYVLHTLGKDAGTDVTVSPDPNTTTLISAIQDGAIVATQSFNNIVIPIAVQVLDGKEADPGQGIPLGVAALLEQCRKTWYDGLIVPLRWMPSVGFGPPCVWQVTAAKLGEANWDDFNELDPEHRGALYLLELTCGPWAFADGSVTETIPAPGGSDATVTVIDACDSAAGWSTDYASQGATITTGSASGNTYVRAGYPGPDTRNAVNLHRTGLAVDMTGTPYLIVTASVQGRLDASGSSQWQPLPPLISVDTEGGTGISPEVVASSGNDYCIAWPYWSGSQMRGVIISPSANVFGDNQVTAYSISVADKIPAPSPNEVNRQFAVEGSVRTPASIAIRGVNASDGTDAALGQVITYSTRAQGVTTPPLRGLRVDGGADSTDSTAYSGKKSALSTTHRFQAPVSTLVEAGYILPLRVQAASTGAKTLTWTAKTVVGGNTVSDVQTGTITVNIVTASTWQMMIGPLLSLPPALAGSAGVVEISLSSTTLTLDEGWLCDLDHGQLTILDAGANTHVWLDAASFTYPDNTVWVGNAADRSDAYIPGATVLSAQQHEVAPPIVNIFVASGAPAEIGLTYTPASLGRAPKVA